MSLVADVRVHGGTDREWVWICAHAPRVYIVAVHGQLVPVVDSKTQVHPATCLVVTSTRHTRPLDDPWHPPCSQ